MADKYTIQIQPQIGASDAQKMENDLNRRFSNVAKKFGSHLSNALKSASKTGLTVGKYAAGAAGVGGVGAIIGTLLTNPIDKLNGAVDRFTSSADEIATRAGQLGVSTEKYAEFRSVTGTAGLDPILALQAFQDLLNEAKQRRAGDQTKNDALVNYLDKGDLLDSFYSFQRAMSKITAEQRSIELGKIYGNRLEAKTAEFFQLTDIEQRKRKILPQGKTLKQLGNSINRGADLEDIQAINREQLKNEFLIKGSRAITNSTLDAQQRLERGRMLREVSQLSQYEIFANLAVTQERMAQSIDDMKAKLIPFLTDQLFPILERMATAMEKIWSWISSRIQSVKRKGLRGLIE
jgi:hypothetical protein